MIAEILQGIKATFRKPVSMLPALIAALIVLLASYLVAGPLFEMSVDIFLLEKLPEAGLEAIPFQFFAMYSGGVIAFALLSVVAMVVLIALGFCNARYALDYSEMHPSISQAIGQALKNLGKIVLLTIFFCVIALFFIALAWIFLLIPIVGTVLFFLLVIAIFYIVIKLVFSVAAMSIEDVSVKEALQKSWEFSQKRFWQIVAFLAIISIINLCLLNIGYALSDAALDDITEIVVFLVFWIVTVTYTTLAMGFYYVKNRA
jgi:hypothetical protein